MRDKTFGIIARIKNDYALRAITVYAMIYAGLAMAGYAFSAGAVKGALTLGSDAEFFFSRPWTLLTYTLLPENFWNFISQSCIFYIAANLAVKFAGRRTMLALLFSAQLIGGWVFLVVSFVWPSGNASLSGAVLPAAALLAFVSGWRPGSKISIFHDRPFNLWIFGAAVTVLTAAAYARNPVTAVRAAYLATLTLAWATGLATHLTDRFFAKKLSIKQAGQKTAFSDNRKGGYQTQYNAHADIDSLLHKSEEQKRLDAILDKISQVGYRRLSQAEKDFLRSLSARR